METSSETKKRSSIVVNLTLWYAGLTLVNIGVFWVGTGSNQMRLISEKATTAARSVAFEILRRARPFTDLARGSKDPAGLFRNYATKFNALLRDGHPSELITQYRILTTNAEQIYAWPVQAEVNKELSAKEVINSMKALQLKEFRNELFIGVPDLSRRETDLFIPLTSDGHNDLVLVTRLPLPDIGKEISALIRLGILMVILLLAVQAGMGFLIYKSFVIPVRQVSQAALILAKGEFSQIANNRRNDDEINHLIVSFNSMSADLKKNRDKMQLELDIARKIQTAILPKVLEAGGITANIYYNPLQIVSGDYYDFLELSDGSVAIFIGDASGHGVPAAFITVMAKVYFTSLVEKIEKPAALFEAMNERMASFFSGSGLYLTAFYLRVYTDGRGEYCNALHPDPLLLRSGGESELLKPSGFYVGMMKKVFKPFQNAEIQLKAGDRIVLYTDGFTEAFNAGQEAFGSERFFQTVKQVRGAPATEMIRAAVESITVHQAGTERQDDETMIVIDFNLPGAVAAAAIPGSYAFEETAGYTAIRQHMEEILAAPNGLHLLRKAAEAALRHRRFDEALAGFMLLYRNGQEEVTTLFHVALALHGLRHYAECLAFLDRVLELDTGFADAYWLKSLCLHKNGDSEAALENIRLALGKNPTEQRYLNLEKDILQKAS